MGRICVIRQGYFPLDTRVRGEVEALVQAGHEVDVICLRNSGELGRELLGTVNILRLPISRRRGSWFQYLVQYGAFFFAATFLVGIRHLVRRYDVVQVNSIPDSHVFTAVIPRLFGARVLLDLHECMPEFFATKFQRNFRHVLVRAMACIEQTSIRFANFAITSTEPMRQAFLSRGADQSKVAVILNSFGLEFPYLPPPRQVVRDRFEVICHGTVEERYGLDTLVHAVALLKDEIPDLYLRIYGDGSYRASLPALIAQLGIADRVFVSDGWVPLEELRTAIATADVGVVAIKRDIFRDLTLCNKMWELIAMRKPAIVSRTNSVAAYFDDSSFLMFTSDDPGDLARAIREIHTDPGLRDRLVENAARASQPYSWDRQRAAYLGIVEALVERRRVPITGPSFENQATTVAEQGARRT